MAPKQACFTMEQACLAMKPTGFTMRQACRIAGQACIAMQQTRRSMYNVSSKSEGVASVGRLRRYAARTIGRMRLPLENKDLSCGDAKMQRE